MNNSIADLTHRVSDFINAPGMKNILVKDYSWDMLCSSLDTIEDIELAIDAYLNSPDEIELGSNYLLIYGILQHLVVQQDAVCHLSESLSIDFALDDSLKQIRDIRNKAVGHPTKMNRGKGNGQSHNFISRSTMSKVGFQLTKVYPNNRYELEYIHIPSLIETQQDKLRCAMSKITQELKKKKMKYKDEYKKSGKLQDVFPGACNYYLSNILETTLPSSRREYGEVNRKTIEDVLSNFKKELEEKKLSDAYTGLNVVLKQTQYPLAELKKFFNKSDESKLNNEDAYIFATYLKLKFEGIVSMTKEIDDELGK